jgi:hypothetical protein
MRNRLALFFLALGFTSPAFAMDGAKIDRLMEIFRVREQSTLAVESTLAADAVAALPEDKRACLGQSLTVDAMFAQMRTHYETLFTDEAVVDQTIAFFSSATGRKLLERVIAQGAPLDREAFMKQFTQEESAELLAFSFSPAGAAFRAMPAQVKPLQDATAQKLLEQSEASCGVPLTSAATDSEHGKEGRD